MSRILIALALILIPATAHAERDAMMNEFAQNRQKWESHSIENYNIVIAEKACYCFFALDYGPVKNCVRNGQIIKTIYRGEPRDGYKFGDRVTEDTGLKMTVDDLFALVLFRLENLEERLLQYFEVQYDDTFGFPVRIEYDEPNIADEQYHRVVLEFHLVNRFGWELSND